MSEVDERLAAAVARAAGLHAELMGRLAEVATEFDRAFAEHSARSPRGERMTVPAECASLVALYQRERERVLAQRTQQALMALPSPEEVLA